MSIKKRLLSTLMVGVLGLSALTGCSGSSSRNNAESNAADADWPTQPINIICAHAAGGDTDYNARLMARMLEQELGVSVVVNNVTGSNGAIALGQYKDSKNADNYTFIMTNTAALTGNLATGLSDFGYEDFQTVGIFGKQSGENIVVPADAPYNTVQELIDASKENPGQIKFGISTGGGVYIAATIMSKEYGAQFNIVDAGDASSRLTSILGGHIDASIVPYSGVKEYIENGDVKVLSTLLEEKPDLIQDIPTAKEQGFDNLILNTMYACLAPEGTDEAVVTKLNEAMQNVAQNNTEYDEEVKKYNYQNPYVLGVDESKEELKTQTDLFMKYADDLQ